MKSTPEHPPRHSTARVLTSRQVRVLWRIDCRDSTLCTRRRTSVPRAPADYSAREIPDKAKAILSTTAWWASFVEVLRHSNFLWPCRDRYYIHKGEHRCQHPTSLMLSARLGSGTYQLCLTRPRFELPTQEDSVLNNNSVTRYGLNIDQVQLAN